MTREVLDATLALREFPVRRRLRERGSRRPSSRRPAASSAACGRRSREQPDGFLDARTIEQEGIDAAVRDFIAGMTDRYAVALFEQLFIPKPWVGAGLPDPEKSRRSRRVRHVSRRAGQ